MGPAPNRSSIVDEIRELEKQLELLISEVKDAENTASLEVLEQNANTVGKAWSGSWLGYHSRIYYLDFGTPPPGAHFSIEWGLMYRPSHGGTTGTWREYSFDEVIQEIKDRSKNPDLAPLREVVHRANYQLDAARDQVISILETARRNREDSFLKRMLDEANTLHSLTAADYIRQATPSGRIASRDTLAVTSGLSTPPHITILADIAALRTPLVTCQTLMSIARNTSNHLERMQQFQSSTKRDGTKVFIGHGRSSLWRELKDFIQDRLGLPWDEFNRKSVAGETIVSRLSEMLDEAAFALLIMTAEDERGDGRMQARMNVIHEVGLFQGRLGFAKAIVLLEEGCEEFSNINGLVQLRFSKGNIKDLFEEVRKVLEREGMLNP